LWLSASSGAIAAGLAYSAGWFRRDSSLQGSGTVEARDIRVGLKVGGRIEKYWCGRANRSGRAVLITFDDKELQAALDQSRAAAEKARRRLSAEEMRSPRGGGGTKAEYEQRKNGYRREDIARHNPIWIAPRRTRYARSWISSVTTLWRKKTVSKQQRDTAEAAWRIAAAQQQNAQHKVGSIAKRLSARRDRIRRKPLP